MLAEWQTDIESLEAICQDTLFRRLFLRMAALSRAGRLEPFLEELRDDEDLDEGTKCLVHELAADSTFLHAVDDYLHRTAVQH